MRVLIGIGLSAALCVGGCSLLFDGNDLHGTQGGGDMGAGGSGGGGGGSGDGDMAGGGGGDMAGPALTTLAFAPAPMTPTNVGDQPYDITVGDFDGDGKLDAATANDGAGTVTVLFGSGDGKFSTVMDVVIPMGSTNSPYAITSGRFNGDAIDDIAVTGTDLGGHDAVFMLLGAANRSITPTAIPALGSTADIRAESIAAGDFNHDGKLDLVTANAGAAQVWIATGKGDGTFDTMPIKLTTTVTTGTAYPHTVVAGDFNGDGRDDIAAGDYNSPTLFVFIQGTTAGSFGPFNYQSGGDINGLAAGNLDNNNDIDVVAANAQQDVIDVFIANGSGAFPAAMGHVPPEYAAHPTPSQVAIADFNRDGKMDIVSANANSPGGSIDVFLGNGDGTFGGANSLGNSATPISVRVGDFNGDGLPDVIVANNVTGNSTVTLLLNTSH